MSKMKALISSQKKTGNKSGPCVKMENKFETSLNVFAVSIGGCVWRGRS